MEDRLNQLLNAIEKLTTQLEQQNARIATLERLCHIQPPKKEEFKKPTEQKPPLPAVHRVEKKEPDQAFEYRFGKYALQIIGIAVFLFGMGFLLKYSIERGWISPLVRIITGFVVATGLIAASEFLSKRYHQWAFGLSAGGIILYYCTLYAAYSFYGLLTLQQAFVGLGLVSLGAIVLALRHDSPVIAVLSLIGAFAAPLVLYINNFDVYFLAYYLLIISAAFLLLTFIKEWYVLSWLSFAGLILYKMSYISLPLGPALLFYGAVFALYVLVPFVYGLIVPTQHTLFESSMITVAGLYTFGALVNRIMYHIFFQREAFKAIPTFLATLFEQATRMQVVKYISLVLGIIFLIKSCIAWFVHKRSSLFYAVSRLTLLFFACFIITQWSDMTLSVALYVYALAILVLGLVLSMEQIRWWSYFFWIYGLLNFILAGFRLRPHPTSWWYNEITITTFIAVILFVKASYLIKRYQPELPHHEKNMFKRFDLAAIFTLFFWMHTIIWKSPYHIFGLAWLAYGLFFIGLYYGKHIRSAAYTIFIVALAYFGYVHNGLLRAGSIDLDLLFGTFVFIFGSILLLYKQYRLNLTKEEQSILGKTIVVGLATTLLLWGRAALLSHFGFYQQHESRPRIHAMLTVYYGFYALALILIGLFKKERYVRYCGLGILALTIYKLWFIIMAMPETLHRIIAFIIVGVLLILASFAYQVLSADEK